MGGDKKNYSREMSDWIQYLISIKSHIYTLFAALITYLSITTVLLTWYIDKQNFIGSFATFVLGIMASCVIIYLVRHKSPLNRAKALLVKIMNGEITNPEEVKEMWNNMVKKRGPSNLRIVSYFSMCLGAGFIFFAAGAMIIQPSNWMLNTQLGNAGMSLFMLGIALLALDFSRESDKRLTLLGKDSNEKMTTIANATFMEIVDIFEDKRIQLVQHPDWLGLEVTIWKCQTYVDRAYDLHKSTKIDYENRHRLFQWFVFLLDKQKTGIDIVENKGPFILKKEHLNNIVSMITKFKDFNLNIDDSNKLLDIEKKVEDLKKEINES